jgi:hypothetical protein
MMVTHGRKPHQYTQQARAALHALRGKTGRQYQLATDSGQ